MKQLQSTMHALTCTPLKVDFIHVWRNKEYLVKTKLYALSKLIIVRVLFYFVLYILMI